MAGMSKSFSKIHGHAVLYGSHLADSDFVKHTLGELTKNYANLKMHPKQMRIVNVKLTTESFLFHTGPLFFVFLAQLISCAITNHYLWRDCRCQHRHCRQKLTSSSVPV